MLGNGMYVSARDAYAPGGGGVVRHGYIGAQRDEPFIRKQAGVGGDESGEGVNQNTNLQEDRSNDRDAQQRGSSVSRVDCSDVGSNHLGASSRC